MNTVQDPDIVALYRKIHDNPEYLDVPNEMTFVESPLHIAASEGRTGLALEILRLKPSLGKKLNLDGLSPLDLALRHGHTNTVRGLIRYDPDIIRVPGREGITPLHYVVETENIDLLIKFLLECPSSIEDLTVRYETAVHIAVRKKRFRAFSVMLGWIQRTHNTTLLRWRDVEGNTLLHLAALTNQPQVMELLINMVDVNAKNFEGKTVLDMIDLHPHPQSENTRKILKNVGAEEGSSLVEHDFCEDYLSSRPTLSETFIKCGAYLHLGLSGDMRNAVLVVMMLVATATYQGALTPPNITSISDKTDAIVNTICFGFAFGACFVLTFDPVLYFLLCGPVSLFLISYGLLTLDVLGVGIIIVAILVPLFLPLFIMYSWLEVVGGKEQLTRRSVDYNLDEVKYLVFSSKYASRR